LAASLGFTEKAFELFNEACENKSYPIIFINCFPRTEDINSDSRFNKILQKNELAIE